MRIHTAALIVLLLPVAASAAATDRTVTRAELSYKAYVAALHVVDLRTFIGLGPWNYRIEVSYHTTGLASLLDAGRQFATAYGQWQDTRAQPDRFQADGVWRGKSRRTLIEYDHGRPELRALVPSIKPDQTAVPAAMQAGSVDLVSALAELLHQVSGTGGCDASVQVFDGRSLSVLTAHTAGQVQLAPTDRSSFAGPALRCDFERRTIAGLPVGESPSDQHGLRGSVWLAKVLPGSGPLPVRLSVELGWVGEAILYLTGAHPAVAAATGLSDLPVAGNAG